MKAGTVGNQCHADQQQEAQGQHLYRRMTIDKGRDRLRCSQHDQDRDMMAVAIIQNSLAIPTAVITLSSENTMSSSMIWTRTPP